MHKPLQFTLENRTTSIMVDLMRQAALQLMIEFVAEHALPKPFQMVSQSMEFLTTPTYPSIEEFVFREVDFSVIVWSYLG